ncbi:MAG: mechanosensitive ion channel [Dehalococcoidia bacterium]
MKEFFLNIYGYLPQFVGALLLALLAWILARVGRKATRGLLKRTKIDERLGKQKGEYPISHGVGTVVWWGIWIFFFLAILETLGVQGMLEPVREVFAKVLGALPNMFAAGLVVVIAWFGGRLVTNWLARALTSIRFNEVPTKLGISQVPTEGKWTASNIVGYAILAVIVFYAVTMAVNLLEFSMAETLVAGLTKFIAQVILGLAILVVGILLARFVAGIIRAAKQPSVLASAVQAFIIVLVGAIGARAMGFANDIIVLGFGLILGAIAVAVAIAFGLGGRDVAREQLQRWTGSSKSKKES